MSMSNQAAIARLEEHKQTMTKYVKPTTDRHNSIATLVRAEEMAIAALREQDQNRWIPVTERLPTEEEYLTRDGDNSYLSYIAIAFRNGPLIEHSLGCFNGKTWQDTLHGRPINTVIAWKPFTEYREGSGRLPTSEEYRAMHPQPKIDLERWSEPKYLCPKCGGGMCKDKMFVLTSYPEQYKYECNKCGYSETQYQ